MMSWQDRAYLTGAICAAVAPLVAILMLLVRRRRYLALVTGWRYRVSVAGLGLALVAALPAPLFYVLLELPGQSEWLPRAALAAMRVALGAGLGALLLLPFARGRVRWLGLGCTLLCVGLVYFVLLGLSD